MSGAILPDGSLNFSRIQREIASDIASDIRYKKENGMKKRAIHTSKDHEEFKAFVACSQLRPVPRSQMSQLFHSSTTTHRNEACQRKDATHSSSKAKKKQPTGTEKVDGRSCLTNKKPPTNPMELSREWNLYCTSPSDTLAYLTTTMDGETKPRISPDDMTRICKTEMEVHIFEGILEALANSTIDSQFVYRWMRALTRCGRFSLHVSLLNDHCRQHTIPTIFNILRTTDPHSIDDTFGTNTVETLKNLFLT